MAKILFAILGIIFYIAFIAFFPVITFLKKRSQLGKTWCEPVEAAVTIKNKKLQCSHCGHDKFSKREGLLNTTWVMFFRFGFWNRSASCFVCQDCGFVHWFVSPDEKAEIQRTYSKES